MSAPTPSKQFNTTVVAFFFAGLAVIGIALYLWSRPPSIERSVLGLNGFSYFARSQGVDIEPFDGDHEINAKDYGLRILPLYDSDVFNSNYKSEQDLDELSIVLRSMPYYVFRRKIRTIPTLVVLPKWRYGTLTKEKLHPQLLIPPREINVFKKNGPQKTGAPYLIQGRPELKSLNVAGAGFPSADLQLYAAQTLRMEFPKKSTCIALSASGTQILLAKCKLGKFSFWLLSDPDVMNNHGAARGDNAAYGLALVRQLSKGKPVIVDNTNRVHTRTALKKKQQGRDRTFADLVRFFQAPFSYLWMGLLFLTAFTLWHSWWRYGPVITGEAGNLTSASKLSAIDANVHILRASNRDGPLAARHVEQQLQVLAADLLGAHRLAGKAGGENLIKTISRRSPELANRLVSLRDELVSTTILNNKISKRLLQFEQTLQEIRHEFGRTSTTRS